MPYPNPNEYKTPMKRARNMGAAHSGAHHWLSVKINSVALIPLSLWFAWALLARIIPNGSTYEYMIAWVQKPYNAFSLVLLLWIAFRQAWLDGQEVFIDYVHERKYQIPFLIAYKYLCHGAAILSIFTVLYLIFRV